ncbi:DNA -binding domain-containing protein, partial [Halomonas marinisediminis]|uniref:DNA -binding domain-containing protein n=1 Tax=Halomonas marinisediminis TaxID=2546095 RepID=UPI0034D43E53
MAIIPLDQEGFTRLDAVFRLLAQLHGRVVPDDKRLTRQKRLRAKRMLQAYDG